MTNWANRSKTEINTIELKPVGGEGKDRIDTFLIYGMVKKDNQKQIVAGDTYQGVYLGSYSNEVVARGKKVTLTTHKIKGNDGKIYGLSGSGLVNYHFNRIPVDANVKVTYQGKDGEGRHQFETLSDSTK